MKAKYDFNPILPREVARCLIVTSSRLKAFRQADFVSGELFGPSGHLLNGKGKLLRPALVFLGACAVGEPCVDFVDLALAVELLHVASLVHDDIIDGGKLRRGRETVNAKYDDGVALLAGDALISKAMQLSSKYGEYIMREASGTALRMCAGELIDYNAQKNDKTLGVDEYLRMVGLKTASLLGMSCSIVAGYRGNGARNALHGYGCDVGTAFQIRDDVLDFMDSGECSGSNVVVSMKKRFGSTDRALEKAIELNHRYVKNAVRRLSGKRMMVLESYAKMTELNLD